MMTICLEIACHENHDSMGESDGMMTLCFTSGDVMTVCFRSGDIITVCFKSVT